MPIDHDPDAPNQSVEVLINGDLISRAVELDLNLSNVLEKALINVVARAQEGEWGTDENRNTVGCESVNQIAPALLAAAIGLFGDERRAVHWLSTPTRALGHKRPLDAGIEEVADLMARVAHGFVA